MSTETQSNDKESKLNIARAERGDTGKYSIKVTNPHGEETADINVIVLGESAHSEYFPTIFPQFSIFNHSRTELGSFWAWLRRVTVFWVLQFSAHFCA